MRDIISRMVPDPPMPILQKCAAGKLELRWNSTAVSQINTQTLMHTYEHTLYVRVLDWPVLDWVLDWRIQFI